MPDFSAQWSGPTLTPWRDPPSLPSLPTRINPTAKAELLRRRTTVGSLTYLRATVAGVLAPLDSALDGRLFMGWFAESPVATPVEITAARSSERRFTPTAAGHYTYVLHRAGGGGIILHLDVVP